MCVYGVGNVSLFDRGHFTTIYVPYKYNFVSQKMCFQLCSFFAYSSNRGKHNRKIVNIAMEKSRYFEEAC